MTYRSDLEAAQARAEQLEQELAAAHQTISQLKSPKKPRIKERTTSRPKREPQRWGKLCLTPPRTYFPLLGLCARAPRAIWTLRWRSPLSRAVDNSLLAVCAHAVGRALYTAVYLPLYLMVMGLLVLPWACIVAALGSILLLPIIPLCRVTVGPGCANTPRTWFHGYVNDKDAAGFLFAITAVFPILYPFTMPMIMK